MTTTQAPTARKPLAMTADLAATEAYKWVAAKPENAGKTPAELKAPAAALLRRMIGAGMFIITD